MLNDMADGPTGQSRDRKAAIEKTEAWLATIDYPQELEVLNRWCRIMADSPGSTLQERMEAAESLTKDAIQNKMLTGAMLPPAGAVRMAIARHRTFHRGTECLIALRRWQLQNDSPPPDLAAVIKAAGMQQLPLDSYSAQPFRMTTIDGRPVIYSVGPDGKDDQGRIEWDFDAENPQGDILFRLP
jgi:hypothetical protein